MNESLYHNFEAVKELNRVDGFDPTKVMRRIVEPIIREITLLRERKAFSANSST